MMSGQIPMRWIYVGAGVYVIYPNAAISILPIGSNGSVRGTGHWLVSQPASESLPGLRHRRISGKEPLGRNKVHDCRYVEVRDAGEEGWRVRMNNINLPGPLSHLHNTQYPSERFVVVRVRAGTERHSSDNYISFKAKIVDHLGASIW